MGMSELKERARAIIQRSVSGNLSILYLDFKRFSNLVLIIHNRLEIGSSFVDQMQFSLKDILFENGLLRSSKSRRGGKKELYWHYIVIFFKLRKYSNS